MLGEFRKLMSTSLQNLISIYTSVDLLYCLDFFADSLNFTPAKFQYKGLVTTLQN